MTGKQEKTYTKERPSALTKTGYIGSISPRKRKRLTENQEIISEKVKLEDGSYGTETCQYLNGVKNGACEIRAYNDILLVKSSYRDGVPDGPRISFYNNGKVGSILNYDSGKLNGVQREYFDNGKLYFEANYINGKKEGPTLSFNEEGNLVTKTEYKSGQIMSETVLGYAGKNISYIKEKIDDNIFFTLCRYDDNMDLTNIYKYENDRKIFKVDNVYNSPGVKVSSYRFRNATPNVPENKWHPDGSQKEWYSDGIPKLEEFYRNGKLEGVRLEWHPNGQLAHGGNFKNGIPHGIFEDFDEHEMLLEVRYFLNGERVAGRDYHKIVGQMINEGLGLTPEVVGHLISKYTGK